MKKIQLQYLLMIALFSSASIMYGMMIPKRPHRLPSTTLINRPQTKSITTKPVSLSDDVSKELITSQTKQITLSQSIKDWFNNLFARKSISKPVILSKKLFKELKVKKESSDIINKLKLLRYDWRNYAFREDVVDFFKQNDAIDIENLLYRMLKETPYHMVDDVVLTLVEKEKIPLKKFIPFIEKFYDQMDDYTIKTLLPYISDPDNALFVEKLFDKTLQKNPELILNYLKRDSDDNSYNMENLRQEFFQKINLKNINFFNSQFKIEWDNSPRLVGDYRSSGTYYNIIDLLPHNDTKRIDAIEHFYNVLKEIRQNGLRLDSWEISYDLMTWVVQKYLKTIKSEQERERLCGIVIKNVKFIDEVAVYSYLGQKPDVLELFISVFEKNMLDKDFVFNEIAETLLGIAARNDRSLAEDFGEFIFQQLSKKVGSLSRDEIACLYRIVKIFLIDKKHFPHGLIELILWNDEDAFRRFGYIVDHMSKEEQKEVVKILVAAFKKNMLDKKFVFNDKGARALLDLTVKNDPELAEDLNMFIVQQLSNYIEKVLDIDNSFAQTPSYKHLQAYLKNLNNINFDVIINDPNGLGMIQRIIAKEKELTNHDYEVFYHARRWQYGFLSDLYSMLYSFKSGKDLDNFIFTHLDDPVLGKVSEKFYASETAKRERLIKEGNPFPGRSRGIADRQSLLFLNKFLFGNLSNIGSCSIRYVLNNDNMGDVEFSVLEIFNMFGFHDAYQAFEKELQELQQEHDNLSKYGEMLQIAVPKDNVDKCIYYTTSGGPKKEFISDGDGEKIKTTDIKTILTELDKNPQDDVEFVLVETRDKFGGLNPESGIKVFSYNTVDPVQWAAFKEKETALFMRIENWMRQKEQGKMARE